MTQTQREEKRREQKREEMRGDEKRKEEKVNQSLPYTVNNNKVTVDDSLA